jgi:hypothetical protein
VSVSVCVCVRVCVWCTLTVLGVWQEHYTVNTITVSTNMTYTVGHSTHLLVQGSLKAT